MYEKKVVKSLSNNVYSNDTDVSAHQVMIKHVKTIKDNHQNTKAWPVFWMPSVSNVTYNNGQNSAYFKDITTRKIHRLSGHPLDGLIPCTRGVSFIQTQKTKIGFICKVVRQRHPKLFRRLPNEHCSDSVNICIPYKVYRQNKAPRKEEMCANGG
jgi:hypothetical protein